jgi:hypothetical protein
MANPGKTKLSRPSAATLISLAALGVSIWSIVETQSTARHQAAQAAAQSALAQAQTVQFTGGLTTAAHGQRELSVTIANYNRYPIIYDEVLWPGGIGRHYVSLGSCYQVFLEAPAASYRNPFKYLSGATLYYETPDGSIWARTVNGTPHRVRTYPRFQFANSGESRIASCTPS